MTTIAVDDLNEAAQFLYDQARNKGYREGQEAERSDHAQWNARQHLDLVQRMLKSAIDAGDETTTRLLALYAKTLLARTPEIYARESLDRLRREESWLHNSSKAADRAALREALEIVTAQLEALGGYR